MLSPSGAKEKTRVADNVPTVASAGAGLLHAIMHEESHGEDVAPALAVREGVAGTHRCDGQYPWRSGCDVCARAALRTQQHNRQLPKPGVLAVDIASLPRRGAYMPAGPPVAGAHVRAEVAEQGGGGRAGRHASHANGCEDARGRFGRSRWPRGRDRGSGGRAAGHRSQANVDTR